MGWPHAAIAASSASITGWSNSRVSVLTVAVKPRRLRSRTIAWRQLMSSSSGSKRRVNACPIRLCG